MGSPEHRIIDRFNKNNIIAIFFTTFIDACFSLPAATKLWPRLCFYSCLWFCPQWGGGLPQCMLGYCHTPPQEGGTPRKESPPKEGGTPQKEASPQEGGTPLPRRPPRPTPKGEIEGDHVQAHTQGGNWGRSDPGPHQRGKLRGSDPGPHPRGNLGGIRSRPPSPPPPRSRLWHTVNERPVRILLECILVLWERRPSVVLIHEKKYFGMLNKWGL